MNRATLPKDLRALFAPLAVIGLFLWLASVRIDLPAAQMDEGSLLVYPEQILQGRLPYRDFETAYGPANPYLLAGAYRLFGPGIFVERAVGLLYRVALLAGMIALAWRWGAAVAAGCAAIATIFLLPTNLAAYAWMGGVTCVVWSLWAATSGENPRRRFWAGLLAAVALLFRPDLGPAVVLISAANFLWFNGSERRRFAAGFACGLVPWAVLAGAVGPAALWSNVFEYPVLHNGRHLPLGAQPVWMIRILGLHIAAALLGAGVGAAGLRAERRDPKARVLLAVGVGALGFTHQAVQRLDPTHLFFACFLSIGMLPVVLLAAAERWGSEGTARRLRALAPVAVLTVIGALGTEIFLSLENAGRRALGLLGHNQHFATHADRFYPVPTRLERAWVEACIETIASQAGPGDRLFVGPRDLRRSCYNDTFLYHLLPKLTPASFFLEMNPGSANRLDSRLAADIASADWLILNPRWDASEPGRASLNGPDAPNLVVQSRFTLVARLGYYEVYRKTPQTAATALR